jgi:hypothetical protein
LGVGACVSAPSFFVHYGKVCGRACIDRSGHPDGLARPPYARRFGGGLVGLEGYCIPHTSIRSVSSLVGLPLSNKEFSSRLCKILYPLNNFTLLLTLCNTGVTL